MNTAPGTRALGICLLALGLGAGLCGCSSSNSSPKSSTPTSSSSSTSDVVVGPTSSAPATTVGSSSATAKPLVSSTSADGTTTITFGAAFVRALFTRGINTSAVGDATLTDTHALRLPITAGSATLYGTAATLKLSKASLQHTGTGLSVTSSRTRVRISGITVALGTTSTVGAQLAVGGGTAKALQLFDLGLGKAPAVRSTTGATLSGITASLTPAAAKALDAAFGSTVFASYAGKQVATVTLAVTS